MARLMLLAATVLVAASADAEAGPRPDRPAAAAFTPTSKSKGEPERVEGEDGSTAVVPASGGSDGADDQAPQAEVADDATGGPILVFVSGRGRVPVESAREPTAASYAIEGELLREPGFGLADALARVPGVQVTRTGGDVDLATAAVRGASSAQTPVYLAGIRLNDELTGSVDLSTLPLWMIHRIEIYRGLSPDHADRDGIGGTVLLEPELPRRTRWGGGLGVGSFGWREGHLGLSFGGQRAGAAFALRHETTRNDFDFVDDRGTRFDGSDDRRVVRRNADATTLDLWTIGRVGIGRAGSLTMLLNRFEREAGAPGLPIVGARHARAAQSRTTAGANARLPCSRAPSSSGRPCEFELSTSAMHSRYALSDPDDELGIGRATTNEGRRLTERVAGRVGVLDWLELRWGGSAEQDQLHVDTARAAALRASRQLARLETGARAHLDQTLDVVLSAALECHTTQGTGDAEACGLLEPVGRVGLRWQLAEPFSLFANVARAVRVPTLGELYGTSAVVMGNPELTPERGVGADVGATLVHRTDDYRIYAQVAGFARWADDLIAFRRSSFGAIRPFNIAAARIVGLELGCGASLWEWVEVGLSLTATDPRDISDGRQLANDLLPLQSRLVAAPFAEVGTPAWPEAGIDRAALGVRYGFRSSRLADPAGLVVLAEQGTLDLTGSVSLLDRRLALRCSISNVLGEQGSDLVGYPVPGRAAHLQMEAWW